MSFFNFISPYCEVNGFAAGFIIVRQKGDVKKGCKFNLRAIKISAAAGTPAYKKAYGNVLDINKMATAFGKGNAISKLLSNAIQSCQSDGSGLYYIFDCCYVTFLIKILSFV